MPSPDRLQDFHFDDLVYLTVDGMRLLAAQLFAGFALPKSNEKSLLLSIIADVVAAADADVKKARRQRFSLPFCHAGLLIVRDAGIESGISSRYRGFNCWCIPFSLSLCPHGCAGGWRLRPLEGCSKGPEGGFICRGTLCHRD